MTSNVKLKTAAGIMSLACVIQILSYLYALPGHLNESLWSDHAQFHHVLGWIWLTGLNIGMLILAWGPLQKGEKWAFWALFAMFIFAHGGHFVASLFVPAGRPSEGWYDFAIGTMSLIWAVGLGTGWRALNKPTHA